MAVKTRRSAKKARPKKKATKKGRANRKRPVPKKTARARKRKAKQPAFLTTRQFDTLLENTKRLRIADAKKRGVPVASAAPLAIDLSRGFDPVGDE